MDSIKKKDYSAEKRLSLRSSLFLIESMRLRLCEATMTGKMKKGKSGKNINQGSKEIFARVDGGGK